MKKQARADERLFKIAPRPRARRPTTAQTDIMAVRTEASAWNWARQSTTEQETEDIETLLLAYADYSDEPLSTREETSTKSEELEVARDLKISKRNKKFYSLPDLCRRRPTEKQWTLSDGFLRFDGWS